MHRKIQPGDYFSIPLGNECDAFGQVLSVEPKALNSVGCAFWPSNTDGPDGLAAAPPIAIQLVTPDLLNKHRWRVQGNCKVSIPISLRPYEAFRGKKWVGANVIGSANIEELLQAFHGLCYWDNFADPEYLNKLLLPGICVPNAAIFKSCS